MRIILVLISITVAVMLNPVRIFGYDYIDVEVRKDIDSLLKILPLSEDHKRVEILLKLSHSYLSISMNSSQEYAKQALREARHMVNSELMAEAYKKLGNISYYKGEFNHVIGYYDSSLVQYRQSNDSFGQSKVLNNLGIIYQHIGDFKTSIDYHLKSLEMKKLLQDSIGVANSYNNIGSIYFDLGNLAKSEEYFNDALILSKQLKNKHSIPGILNNLGLIKQEMGLIQKSYTYFQEAIDLGEELKDYQGVAVSYHNYAKSLFLAEQYTEALDYYNNALTIYDELGIKNSQTLNNIGHLYLELDYYQKALQYFKQALNYADGNNQFKVLSEIYKNLAVSYERMDNFKEAYYHYVQYNLYEDSLTHQIYSSRIDDIINQNETEKNREQLEKARLRIEKAESDMRSRNITIYAVIAGLIGVLIFAFVILRLLKIKEKSNLLLKQQNDEILRSQETIKKINKALTESEATLRSIFDVSPFTIFVIDDRGMITDCNDTSLKMFRAKHKRDILEQNIEKFVGTEVENPSGQLLADVKENRLSKSQYVIKRIDLTTFHAELTGRLIHKGDGEGDSYIIVVSDITERLKFIENLKAAKIKAEESDTLKTAFLTNMSHEIRTPMNSIIGFSNLLTDQHLDEQKRQDYLSHILQSSSLLLNLIDDIIDISKIEAGQMKFVDEDFVLNEVITERFKTFHEVNADKPIQFKLDLPENSEGVYCHTDALRFKQVLGNLLSNAVKFTSEGVITMGYTLKTAGGNQIAEVFVKDTGIGIPYSKQEIIFQRFRQVDDSRSRNFGGTGLGLAICKRLVELMKGEIWVDSEPNTGSEFYFTIPVVLKQPVPVKVVQSNHKNGFDWSGRTLLIAEDEHSNYELIRATLGTTGIKLIRAYNGEEAIQIVKENPQIDLVLMDIRMPKINGYDATRQIKAMRQELPVLSITAYAMTEDESKSLAAGCDTYISKPVKPAKLLELLNTYFN